MSNQATARIYRTGEVTDYMSISTMEHGGTWRKYNGPVENAIDCIQIREALSGFHLEYRTWNEGVGKYYPYVNSEDDSADSYAGLAGKAIQRVNIVAYDDNNNKVDTGIVVMYRARVDGNWLPWVSNANAASMQSVQEKYGGMDDLDITSGYAGISGKNMDGFQIRVFVEQPIGGNTGGASDPSQGNFNGSEVNLTLSYMKDNESNWVGFNKSAFPGDYIDGIKIQTSSSDEFYLSYKTKPAGSDYFSAVLSTDSSQYAGLPGRHIQRLSISAYDKGGNKLDKGVVIMYRAYVDSKWLPWVSNAAPDWMENVWNTFDLPGTLDTSSGYAGVDGKDIKGVEIRAFVGNNINGSLTGLLGMEVSPTSSRYLVGNQWYSFHKKVEASRIDGIEIKTDPNKSYYLSYQTQNEGKSTFYPAVTSLENDYAGYPNKAVQTVGIRVFTNDGAKVDSGVVVMLRTKTGGRWLPWVSNADPEWMRSVQRKYGLNLTLDTSSYEAGIQGQNIEGIEVRIFEETGIYAGAQTPAGKTKIIKNVPFIYQMNDWPTGCESVSTVMALNHAGNSMTVDTFINNYLDKQPYPFDPDETFGGDPTETENSFGCYAPVIKKALDKALANTEYHATQLSNMSMLSLCSQYIDNDIPVIMWATMEMREAYISRRWTYNGKVIQWIAPEHCLLLVGYTDTHYIFNDPLQHKNTYYGKSVVENAYEAFSRQAIIIRKNEPVNQPFNYNNYEILKNELSSYVDNHLDVFHKLISWHSSQESLDTVLNYDNFVTQYCNKFNMQKELLQTVFFREQRFVWFADDVADSIVEQSYAYDENIANNMSPPPQMPIPYRHDCSTGLCQIFASTAIKSINYAVQQNIIDDERLYDQDNLDDIKEVWFKLKDNSEFNIKCAVLTLIYEALHTLQYDRNFVNYTESQISMLFTKYNSTSDEPNEYGTECTEWYNIFRKYR